MHPRIHQESERSMESITATDAGIKTRKGPAKWTSKMESTTGDDEATSQVSTESIADDDSYTEEYEGLSSALGNFSTRYFYKQGRSFEFRILVNGEDYDFEVEAAIMCIVSDYFSEMVGSSEVDNDDWDYMQVNVDDYSPEVVGRVLELVYHLDTPNKYLKELARPCKSENPQERHTALNKMLAVLGLASEWRIPRLEILIQHTIIHEGILLKCDLDKVYLLASEMNAVILQRACERLIIRSGKEPTTSV
ncbi:hypothetical protein VNI00_007769 [Paramarasmius palmivorus]|uniref:BTB domain-containing protein n=1 Tax=Paramarasmius palmivorus TaxID=297713 RepID=A0AAW0CXR6_9AGAR